MSRIFENENLALVATLKQELAEAALGGVCTYLRTTRGARLAGALAAARVEKYGDRIVVDMGDGAVLVWKFGVE